MKEKSKAMPVPERVTERRAVAAPMPVQDHWLVDALAEQEGEERMLINLCETQIAELTAQAFSLNDRIADLLRERNGHITHAERLAKQIESARKWGKE